MAALLEDERGLDRDRVASMADEGGSAAAEVEAQGAVARLARSPSSDRGPGLVGLLVVGGLALVALALALGRRPQRQDGEPVDSAE